MDLQNYIENMKIIQNNLLRYVENGEDVEENYQNLVKEINNRINVKNADDFKILLKLILFISENHYNLPDFFGKITNILIFFKIKIKQTFSNFEIFHIFKKSKRILLFLIEQQMLIIDKLIAKIMKQGQYKNRKYPEFFFPEIKAFLDENELNEILKDIPENFEKKRQIGQNDEYICQLIRNDSIDEFISYINKTDYPINSMINTSIFETNSYILNDKYPNFKKDMTPIRYAAFFGSVQIFKYLYKNNAEKNEVLILDSIHGDCPEIIHILEETKFDSKFINIKFLHKRIFELALYESIKCHHNDISIYIQENWLKDIEYQILQSSIHYCNFFFLPKDFDLNTAFFYFCEYGYLSLVKLVAKTVKVDPNIKIIPNSI